MKTYILILLLIFNISSIKSSNSQNYSAILEKDAAIGTTMILLDKITIKDIRQIISEDSERSRQSIPYNRVISRNITNSLATIIAVYLQRQCPNIKWNKLITPVSPEPRLFDEVRRVLNSSQDNWHFGYAAEIHVSSISCNNWDWAR